MTLAVAIPTGEAGIQSLAKALLRRDQAPVKKNMVSYTYQFLFQGILYIIFLY